MYYSGIGSRVTPVVVQELFIEVGKYLSTKKFILRSGHAKGADQAFEKGCDSASAFSRKEIYLPWYGFEGSNSKLIVKGDKAFEIAESFHPYWHNLSRVARVLQARNSYQVLGLDLNTPSDFIICWTEGGKGKGGTGQAIRIGRHYGIPIFDGGKFQDVNDIKSQLTSFIEKAIKHAPIEHKI